MTPVNRPFSPDANGGHDGAAGSPWLSPEKLFILGNALQSRQRGTEAMACYRRSLALDPTSAAAQTNLGTVLLLNGYVEEALTALRRALSLDPASAHILANLGNAHAARGGHEAASVCYRNALALDPRSPGAHYGLANLHAGSGQHQWAIRPYLRAAILQPDFSEACNNLGNSLQALRRPEDALACHHGAIAAQPGDAKTYNNLGSALQALDRVAEAITCYDRAIVLAPTYAEAHYNLGTARIDIGDADGAYRALSQAIALEPKRGCFHRMLAETGRLAPDGSDLRRMVALDGGEAPLPDAERMELHFALGKAYADQGRQKEAFRHLLAGNRMRRQGLVYDETATLNALARLPRIYTRDLLERGARVGSPSPPPIPSILPIFVVGMPRSGTTLIEQVLASHPAVHGAGELRDLQRLADDWSLAHGLPLPEAAPLLPDHAWRDLGEAYVEAVARRAPGARYIVDKMPSNFTLIGLIRMALPRAKIIHAIRDPLDTCVSFFSKLFSGRHPFAYDLAELGRYYRAYQHLMEYWRQAVPEDAMIDVRYEDMIDDMEGQARRLLAHCGLDWDPRCLDFHRTERVVRTASAMQVRQPLYRTSVGRWQAYGELIDPLREALEGEGGTIP